VPLEFPYPIRGKYRPQNRRFYSRLTAYDLEECNAKQKASLFALQNDLESTDIKYFAEIKNRILFHREQFIFNRKIYKFKKINKKPDTIKYLSLFKVLLFF